MLGRLGGLIVRVAIFFVAVGIVAAGVTMILNNETIFERPGLGQRVERFLSKNSAAASQTGSSAVICVMENPAPPPPAAAPAPPKPAPNKEPTPQTQATQVDHTQAEPAATHH